MQVMCVCVCVCARAPLERVRITRLLKLFLNFQRQLAMNACMYTYIHAYSRKAEWPMPGLCRAQPNTHVYIHP